MFISLQSSLMRLSQMLKRLENGDIAKTVLFLGDDAVSVRIKSFLLVYKCDYSFCEGWAQFDDENTVTGVLLKLNGVCTLSFSESADTEEIKALLRFIGFSSLFLNKDCAELLGLKSDSCGDILACEKIICGDFEAESFTDMKKAFAMISENEGESIVKLDYLEWLSDFTFKSNRRAARLCAINENGAPVSFAMTSAETENAAIVSGVFTDKERRNQGLGERVLKALSKSLFEDNKKIYIMTATDEMSRYYEKRGFHKVDRWCEIKGEI